MTTETPAADIVELLKRQIPYQGKSVVAFLCHEAADEITRLRAENAELRKEKADYWPAKSCACGHDRPEDVCEYHRGIANAELQRKLDEAVSGLFVVNRLIADGPNPSVLDAVAKISLTVSKTLSSIHGEV